VIVPEPDDRDFPSASFTFGGEGDFVPGDKDGLDDLAALDFGPTDPEAFDQDEFIGDMHGEVREDGVGDIPLYVVSNPEETVTVTTMMDGRIRSIVLSANASRMTESELAAEIVVISKLAAQKAKAAQYLLLAHQMAEQGYDAAASKDFLTRELNLPTPDDAAAARAKAFASRYSEDDD
jgi:hypothetical protein